MEESRAKEMTQETYEQFKTKYHLDELRVVDLAELMRQSYTESTTRKISRSIKQMEEPVGWGELPTQPNAYGDGSVIINKTTHYTLATVGIAHLHVSDTPNAGLTAA